MFFGGNLQERRRQLSHKAGETRRRRQDVVRWRARRPFTSRSGVELRLDPKAKKFALGWMGEIFEIDGQYMLNATILTDQSIAGQAIGGMIAGGAGALLGAVGAGAAAPAAFQPLRSVGVRLHMDVPRFAELDFQIWESSIPVGARSAQVKRAFATAEEFVRLCLSVR
jgi:hypothetical protein